MLKVGKKIKTLRNKAGMTQLELGEKIGFADCVVRRHENGGANPKDSTLEKYAEALGVNPEVLICSDLTSIRAMHHLFRIFEIYKGEFHTVTTSTTDENGNQIEKESVAVSFDLLNEYMKEWKSVYEKSAFSDEESEKADYYDYIYHFPENSNVDQATKDYLIEYDKKVTY